MLPINRLYSRSRSVQLGTRIFQVGEMRVSDMVDIQNWLEDRWQCPLEALGASLSDLDDSRRRNVLFEAWDALEAGPPLFGTPESTRQLDTYAGSLFLLSVILKHYHPELTAFDLEQVQSECTQEQYSKLLSAWRGVDKTYEVAAILGFLPDELESSSTMGWPEAILGICEAYGWTLDYVYGLTVNQLRTIFRGGKPIEYGTPVAPKTSLKETMMARRKQIEAIKAGSNNDVNG